MKHTVLVVDDDAAVLASLAGVLHSEGYHVIHATDGEKAVSSFREAGIDLVLLDLKMPKKKGWETFEEIAAIEPLVPVVVITALPVPHPPAHGAAVSALIEKPVDIPILLATIRDLIRGSLEGRKAKLSSARSGAINRTAARSGSPRYQPDEMAARFFANGFLKRTQHAPFETPESRLQTLRMVWNRCGQAEQRIFMEEVEAIKCARDFFL
jgi:DNA-binding response OmpR family regulator